MRYLLNIQDAKLRNIISDEDAFFEWLAMQDGIFVEMDKNKNIIFMEHVGCKYGQYNVAIFFELGQWNKQKKLGVVFGSSAGFTLPNGAVRSPDVSWVSKDRDRMLSKEEKEKFAPICPDFVVELKSPGQSLKELQEKMEEYMENGAKLGWLIDMDEEKIWIYEEGKEVRLCEGLKGKLSGEPYLPGFALDLDELKRLKEE